MRVLDLFSGIGGFSLGLDRAGFETVAFCEIEEYPRKILKKHWPDVPIFEDVRKLNKEVLNDAGIGSVDVICGGFPCQPFSVAGKQGGEKDDRHLWPEMYRLIKELKPSWVIGENVAGFISMALDDVLFNLESQGYETQSFVIPACAVGGIHRRDRVWIVAYSDSQRKPQQSELEQESGERASYSCPRDVADTQHNGTPPTKKPGSQREAVCHIEERKNEAGKPKRVCPPSNVADSGIKGLQRGFREGAAREEREPFGHTTEQSGSGDAANATSRRQQARRPHGKSGDKTKGRERKASDAINDGYRHIEPPSQPPVRHRDDGLPDNVARLKALGNAVVPQIPELIGRAILKSLT